VRDMVSSDLEFYSGNKTKAMGEQSGAARRASAVAPQDTLQATGD